MNAPGSFIARWFADSYKDAGERETSQGDSKARENDVKLTISRPSALRSVSVSRKAVFSAVLLPVLLFKLEFEGQ